MFRARAAISRRRAPLVSRRAIGAGILALVLLALAAGAALAASAVKVGSAANPTLNETVVVDSHGRTLYTLHPETTHHLLCKSHACLEAWPPLTVHSASVKLVLAHGVEGHLGILHRRNGMLQVTLRGLPLYRYAGDSGKDEANGEGIHSFGGTWHAANARAHSAASQPTTTMSTPPSPQY